MRSLIFTLKRKGKKNKACLHTKSMWNLEKLLEHAVDTYVDGKIYRDVRCSVQQDRIETKSAFLFQEFCRVDSLRNIASIYKSLSEGIEYNDPLKLRVNFKTKSAIIAEGNHRILAYLLYGEPTICVQVISDDIVEGKKCPYIKDLTVPNGKSVHLSDAFLTTDFEKLSEVMGVPNCDYESVRGEVESLVESVELDEDDPNAAPFGSTKQYVDSLPSDVREKVLRHRDLAREFYQINQGAPSDLTEDEVYDMMESLRVEIESEGYKVISKGIISRVVDKFLFLNRYTL